jgi:fatty-acid desaturase
MLLLAPLAAGGLITLLVWLIVVLVIAGLIFWCVNRLSAAFGIPEPVRTVIIVALVVIVVVGVLYALTGAIPR